MVEIFKSDTSILF